MGIKYVIKRKNGEVGFVQRSVVRLPILSDQMLTDSTGSQITHSNLSYSNSSPSLVPFLRALLATYPDLT
jgi:hypothetical protein